jgi:hypothetical protein
MGWGIEKFVGTTRCEGIASINVLARQFVEAGERGVDVCRVE